MRHVLVLGYSNIVQRRALAAMAQANVSHVDVATLSQATAVALPEGMTGQVFDDYATALGKSGAELAYISTVNSNHASLAAMALEHGLHVVVEKPVATSFADAEKLLETADRKNLCLAEATVYPYHPQIQAARDVFSRIGAEPTRILATFTFPPLPEGNFRYKPELGGGSLLDQGAYAVSPGRLFFGREPEDVTCRVLESRDGVDLSFCMLADYGQGKSMVGQFSFNTGYRNRLDLLGPSTTVTIDRIFTPTPDFSIDLQVNQNNTPETVSLEPADTFANFFAAVLQAIENKDHGGLARDLLMDARTLDRMRRSAGVIS